MQTANKNQPASKVSKTDILKSAEGYPLIGHVVYWSVTEFLHSQKNVIKNLEEVGIDKGYAREVKPKSALLRAAREETRGGQGRFPKALVDNKEKFGLVIVGTKDIDEVNVDASFKSETVLSIDKGTKKVSIEGTGRARLEKLVEKYDGMYTSEMFRLIAIRYLIGECDALSVRERGGVYFVPAHMEKNLQKLVKLFGLYKNTEINLLPIIDNKQAKASMWNAMTGDVTAEIERLQKDLERMDDEPSERSINTRLERYNKLKDKIGRYEDLLSGTASEMKGELDKLSKLLAQKMS